MQAMMTWRSAEMPAYVTESRTGVNFDRTLGILSSAAKSSISAWSGSAPATRVLRLNIGVTSKRLRRCRDGLRRWPLSSPRQHQG